MYGNEIHILNRMSRVNASKEKEKEKKQNLKWTTQQDDALLSFMLECTREGNTIPKGCSKEGWDQIVRKMTAIFKPNFEKEKYRKRHKAFKSWYAIDECVRIRLGS